MVALTYPRSTTIYKLGGTETLRASSAAFLEIFGGNLQNISDEMRRLFWADEGYKLVQVDQSGAEALIVAYLCTHGKFRDLFLNNVKPHVFVAMNMFLDIWIKKCHDLDVVSFANTPIPELKTREGWKTLDALIKESDKWKPQERYYYIAKMVCHACLDNKTELLTPSGWKSVTDITVEDSIASWSSTTDNIQFEKPSNYHVYDYTGDMVSIQNDELDQLVTPNHRVVYSVNKKYTVKQASEIFSRQSVRIPLAGNFVGGDQMLSNAEIKLLVAIQADGYITSKQNVRFRFIRERKVDRLLSILKELNLDYTYRLTDAHEFMVTVGEKLLSFFGETKVWGAWLLNFSRQNLEVWREELKYWDGSHSVVFDSTTKRTAYYSKHSVNCEWVKTISHLLDKQATVNFSSSGVFIAGLNNRKFSRIGSIKNIPYNGKVYCPTVSTGFILIRRNGKISITGNSNYGIRGNAFRLNVIEKSKGKIVLTKQQADTYLAKYHALFPEIQRWHREVEQQLQLTGVLYNLQGFPRVNTGKLDDYNMKDWYAFAPQSTVGLITHKEITNEQTFINVCNNKMPVKKLNGEVDEALQRFGLIGKRWTLLNNCHDSSLTQAPEGEERECAAVKRFFMQQNLVNFRGENFQMKSEAAAGLNWGKYKADKNEFGMKEL